ncbi:uncharacterized protein LOC104901502 [Beta vulgaris subsp. vulgaris]|uniref:uncharacterized protein LOC104901502 n=1 Tax=Beta vulgaris subsp. vulgaris TaxID=3555 RepID=UPI00254741B4|nr:uncharacterized protein LOC104901502 [Beta vulgaris subsp. vulgaris]
MVAWNVRGLNDPIKIKETRVFLQQHGVDFCALFETRVRDHKASNVQKKLGNIWSWEDKYGFSPRGRIWIGWKPGVVSVNVVRKTEQCVMVQVASLEQNHVFSLIVVYGLHTIADRRQLWVDLREMVDNVDFPYLIIGDFNAVSRASDRINGTLVSEAETVDFSDFLMEVGVLEAPCSGAYYSWNNKGTVREAWESTGDTRKLKSVWKKLKAVKEALKRLHSTHYSQAHLKVEEFRTQLENVQTRMASSGDVELHQEEEEDLVNKLRHWSAIEDSILRQKARIRWLTMADANTRFFFNAIKVRKARNNITMLQTATGELVNTRDMIQAEIVGFYTKLMGTRAESLPSIDLYTIRTGRQLSYDARTMLSQSVTHAEIDQALFTIDDNKAPGLDRFNALFIF